MSKSYTAGRCGDYRRFFAELATLAEALRGVADSDVHATGVIHGLFLFGLDFDGVTVGDSPRCFLFVELLVAEKDKQSIRHCEIKNIWRVWCMS